MNLFRRTLAELIGTFWLAFCGCGSALIAANFHASADSGGIGLVGVSLVFGLTVLTMIYAVGHISGGHFNPAVTLGLTVAGRFQFKDVVPYIASQVIGAIIAIIALKEIMTGAPGVDLQASTFAANGFAGASPGHYSMTAALLCETIMTAFFTFVILGATDKRAPQGFAGLAIGLCLTLIHLVSIPITNTSVNPARSTGPAIVAALSGNLAPLGQLWLFWLAPCLGAIVAALIYAQVASNDEPAAAVSSAALGTE
ncbi:MAG: aquaporin Z [Trinickia sp.]|uniref:aquaporin Z n=1 Tax=Trinickia sp. TaxID=2571163 RepID=UPI003F8072A0